MLEYIIENKEWMFSGIGISAIAFIFFIFKLVKKNSNKGKKEVGESKTANCYKLVPRFLLKILFPESRIKSLVKIDVRPRGDSVNLNLGELPKCQIWLQVTNHSPFNIDFESIKGVLNYNGCRIDLENKSHIDIKQHSTIDSVYLEGTLTGEQAVHCSTKIDNTYSLLELQCRLRTNYGLFKICTGDLQSLHVRVINRRKNTA